MTLGEAVDRARGMIGTGGCPDLPPRTHGAPQDRPVQVQRPHDSGRLSTPHPLPPSEPQTRGPCVPVIRHAETSRRAKPSLPATNPSSIRLMETLFIAALFSLPASTSQACAVDGVAAITATTISISWDLTSCKRLSAGHTFEVCWKKQADSGNACIPPVLYGDGETGITTITGLSPATAYRIRTLWHQRSNWWDVTTRITSTQASPGSSSFLLRYEKGQGQKYCTTFYWKGPALPPIWIMELHVDHWVLGSFTYDKKLSPIVTGSPLNTSTAEYSATDCGFSNNQRYRAVLAQYTATNSSPNSVSNFVEWK